MRILLSGGFAFCPYLGNTPVVFAGDPAAPHFTDVAKAAGLHFRHNYGGKQLENVLMTTGSGCALFDYDNDGWLDALLVNGTYLDKKGRLVPDKATSHALFHNRGDGTFENETEAAGLAEPSYGQGCALGDFDGDGFTDVYLTNYGPNQLYHNEGDGTFKDVTKESGTGDARWAGGAVFFDFDADRDLDLFVANYLEFRPDMKGVKASALSKRTGFRFFPGPRDYEPDADVLYRNNGDGTFIDVSRECGIELAGRGLTSVAIDFDNDGDQDLFIANDRSPNFLYRNDSGEFTDVALEAGVAYDPDGVETAGMGIAVADLNSDGLQDLYVTNMLFEFNNLYMNQGDMLFMDKTKSLGLDDDNFRHVGWATGFLDFNHDGNLDCFVANGHLVDYVEGFSQSITYAQRNMLFLGNDSGHFNDVADDCGEHFRRKKVSRGAAFGDFDNDGDVDILVNNSGEAAQLLRNDLPVNDRWVKFRLKGQPPNTNAIGAKVVTRIGDRTLHCQIHFGASYLSGSDPTIHAGLPPGVEEGDVDVFWPSGKRSTHKVFAATPALIEEPRAIDAAKEKLE
jgi:hypothetical protein